MDIKIEDLKAYRKKIGEKLQVVYAKINNEEHYTADIREIGVHEYAVFSDITKDGITKDGTKKCIELGIYVPVDIELISFQTDHYIWVKFE